MPRIGYADIAAHFRQKIESGDLSPGDRLPSMANLVHEFHTSTMTAVRAYRILKEEGLTVAIPGVGTIVADGKQGVQTPATTLVARAPGSPVVIELSREEGAALFDGRVRRWLGMSGTEFLERWDAGEFLGSDNPAVMAIATLIPFAREVPAEGEVG